MELETVKIILVVSVLAGLYLLEGIVPMFGRRSGRLRHGAANVGLGLINAALVAVAFAWMLVAAATWAEDRGVGLLHQMDWPVWAEWIIAILLFDLWMYGWHVANHRVRLLWRFHQVHHADAALDATSAVRFHTGEIALSSIARLAVLPLLGLSIPQLLVYELILQPIILLHHSNVRFPAAADRVLSLLIVTPRIHWVHHSKVRRETDSNYGSIFSFWDRGFRTLRRREPADIVFGLDYSGKAESGDLRAMLKMPFTRPGPTQTPRGD